MEIPRELRRWHATRKKSQDCTWASGKIEDFDLEDRAEQREKKGTGRRETRRHASLGVSRESDGPGVESKREV